MSQPDVLGVPQIQAFQLDGGGVGDIQRSVNLFRGDAGFALNLVSLTGRNGLDVAVAALCRSNVDRTATLSNLTAPTGPLGVGWSMPVDRITVATRGSGAPADWEYTLVRAGIGNRLYRTARRWLRATVDGALATTLTAGPITQPFRSALTGQGLLVDASATVTVVDAGRSWTVVDAVREFTLAVEAAGGALHVFDGGVSYEAQSFDFSRIRYYPAFQRWAVTHDNGITDVFGGSGAGTVQWGVRWGGWLGPSTITHDDTARVQQRFPVDWNFARSYTPWGDEVRFEYEQDLQPVGAGGLQYTKACYLSGITDVFGRTVGFGYRDKVFRAGPSGSREYVDPEKEVPDGIPDAFQSRYETRYLDRVTVSDEQGDELYRLDFAYDLRVFATLPADAPPWAVGDRVKRVLTAIRRTMPDGTTPPDVTFDYSAATDPNPGAIRSMTTASGGTVTYEYQAKQLTACVRDVVVRNPFPQGTPRVWFGPDYAVVVWFDDPAEPRRYQVTVHTWCGRWRRWRGPVVDAAPDLADVRVETTAEFFVLHHRMRGRDDAWVQVLHRDERVLGGWLPNAGGPLVAAGVREVVCGSQFFAVGDGRTVVRHAWDPLARVWLASTPDESPTTAGRTRIFLTAVNSVLTSLHYDIDGSPGSKKNLVRVHEVDELGGWRLVDECAAPDIAVAGSTDAELDRGFRWAATPWGPIASFVTDDRGRRVAYAVKPFTGDERHRLTAFPAIAFELTRSAPSGALTIPFAARAAASGLVASGPNLLRYNGKRWLVNDALKTVLDVEDDTAFWFALGTDVAVKTENSPDRVVTAACVHDPNQDSVSWTRRAVTLYDNPPGQPRRTRYFPTAATGFLSYDTDLYARGRSPAWTGLRGDRPYALPAGAVTTATVNEGDFVACLAPDRDGGLATVVTVLADGYPTRREVVPELLHTPRYGEDSEGMRSAGPGSLVTFPAGFERFDLAQRLTLRRFAGNSVLAAVEDRPVYRVTIDDGYQRIAYSYEFDISTAECDPTGSVVKYYRSWVTAGPVSRQSETGWSCQEYVNGLGGHDGDANPTAPALLDGLVKRSTTYDAAGTEVASSESDWVVVTSAPDTPGGPPLPLRGAYVQARSTTEARDGVTRTTTLTYDPCSGQNTGRSTTIHNGQGDAETHTIEHLFAHRVYPALLHANVLGTTVQSAMSVAVGTGTPVVTRVEATTLRPWDRPVGGDLVPVWANGRNYRWLGGDGPSDFDFTATTPGAAWALLGEVLRRSGQGHALERTGPGGVLTSMCYDKADGVAVVTFTNASPWRGDAFYTGFESYEDNRAPVVSAPAEVVADVAHTGARCLRLPTSDGAVVLRLTPLAGQRYLFGFWARTGPGYDPAVPAGWRLAQDGQPPVDVRVRPGNRWQYHLQEVTGSGALTCTAYNSGATDVHLDDIVFSCRVGQHRVSVYDQPTFAVGAEVGPYDAVALHAFDSLLRPVAVTDHAGSVVRIAVSSLSRQTGAAFDAAEPNSTTLLQPMGDTMLDRFRDGTWRARWTTATPEQWSTVAGRLEHHGDALGQLTLTAPTFTGDYALHLGVTAPAGGGGALGLRVGSVLSVLWDQASGWTLTEGAHTRTVAAARPGRSWLLVLTGDAVLFLVDGRRVFSHLTSQPVTGQPSIVAAAPVSFTNAVAGAANQVGVQFSDGAGKARQGHSLEGAAAVVSAQVYDGLGRAAVVTKPAACPATDELPLLAYRPGFVTGLDWTTGVLTGEVADAHPADEGYPYRRQRFEPSGLGRTVEVGAPGKAYAIVDSPDRHTTRLAYGSNDRDFGPALHLPAGCYRVQTTTDADGRQTAVVTDALGGPVLTALLADRARERYIVTSVSRDHTRTGREETLLLPNHHQPPGQSGPGAWARTTTYDMLDRAVDKHEPDSGRASWVHDRSGQVRFAQDSSAAGAGMVNYSKYDLLGRLLEQGRFPRVWDRATLSRMADEDPAWPGPAQQAVPTRTYHYDGTGLPDAGRLTAVTTGAATVRYGYDERGRVATEQVAVGAETHTTAYRYDNLGNTTDVDYPSGTRLRYVRDRAGRVVRVRDAGAGVLATYGYDVQDRVTTESIAGGVTAAYTYAPPGWLTAVTSPLFTETLDRGDSHSGKIHGQDVRFALPERGDFALSAALRLSYDAVGRLSTVDQTTSGAHDTQRFAYDDNGNISSVVSDSGTENYTYGPGSDFALNTDGSARHDYDPGSDGSVLAARPRGITGIAYDIGTGRPTEIVTAGGTMSLAYDEKGLRLVKSTAAAKRIYVRNTSGLCITEQDRPVAGPPSTTDYLFGPTGLFALRRDGKLLPVLRDHLRAPRLVIDDDGVALTAFQYGPFGDLICAYRDQDVLRYRFGGYEFDAETGLYNANARLYDPKLRRFYSVDPQRQFASPYLFAGNDPLGVVDPSGAASWWATLIGMAAGAIVTVLTGGVGAALFGMGIAAGVGVAAVAGAAGTLVGDVTTALIEGESITARRLLADVLGGAAGGAAGAAVGGVLARSAMRWAFDRQARASLVTLLGNGTAAVAGGTTGAATQAGVGSVVAGTPLFSWENGLAVAMGALSGIGGALLSSGAHFGWWDIVPVEVAAGEAVSKPYVNVETIGGKDYHYFNFESAADGQGTLAAARAHTRGISQIFEVPGAGFADVIDTHGVGRYVFVSTPRGYRPMKASSFAQHVQNVLPRLDGDLASRTSLPPIKLTVCFGATPWYGSAAQRVAGATERTVWAGRGTVLNYDQSNSWKQF